MRFLVDALSVGPATHFVNSRGQVVLTPREEQAVNLVAEGLNNREIAAELSVKEGTVKKSLLRIYDKTGRFEPGRTCAIRAESSGGMCVRASQRAVDGVKAESRSVRTLLSCEALCTYRLTATC